MIGFFSNFFKKFRALNQKELFTACAIFQKESILSIRLSHNFLVDVINESALSSTHKIFFTVSGLSTI
jgi:hypothetical protein